MASFIKQRQKLFDQIKQKRAIEASTRVTQCLIEVHNSDQSKKTYKNQSITPFEALGEDASKFQFAEVKYASNHTRIYDPDSNEAVKDQEWQLVDLKTPLEHSCQIRGVLENQNAFWHSSAHILGFAIEQHFRDPLLTVGPPT